MCVFGWMVVCALYHPHTRMYAHILSKSRMGPYPPTHRVGLEAAHVTDFRPAHRLHQVLQLPPELGGDRVRHQ